MKKKYKKNIDQSSSSLVTVIADVAIRSEYMYASTVHENNDFRNPFYIILRVPRS